MKTTMRYSGHIQTAQRHGLIQMTKYCGQTNTVLGPEPNEQLFTIHVHMHAFTHTHANIHTQMHAHKCTHTHTHQQQYQSNRYYTEGSKMTAFLLITKQATFSAAAATV